MITLEDHNKNKHEKDMMSFFEMLSFALSFFMGVNNSSLGLTFYGA